MAVCRRTGETDTMIAGEQLLRLTDETGETGPRAERPFPQTRESSNVPEMDGGSTICLVIIDLVKEGHKKILRPCDKAFYRR